MEKNLFIILTSSDSKSLYEYANKLKDIFVSEYNIEKSFLNFIYMPKKIKRISLLQSPHVHKKTKEHFESITHKIVIKINIKKDTDNLANYTSIKILKNKPLNVNLTLKI